jgi:hypothetical protein
VDSERCYALEMSLQMYLDMTESGREAVSVHVGDEVAVILFTAIGKLMGTIQTISLSPKNVNRAELRPLVKMSAS